MKLTIKAKNFNYDLELNDRYLRDTTLIICGTLVTYKLIRQANKRHKARLKRKKAAEKKN